MLTCDSLQFKWRKSIMTQTKITPRDLTVMALFAALLCVSSYISIPLPFSAVSLTLQTLIINMIAILLPPKKAGLTVLVWMLLGLAGLPVFSGGMGGLAKLFGPTGGYIFGYLAAAILLSLLKGKKGNIARELVVIIAVGMPLIYLIGTPWMMAVTGIGWKAALLTGVVPFLPGDVAKCVGAVLICRPLKKALWNKK